jgi:hypothetical protein
MTMGSRQTLMAVVGAMFLTGAIGAPAASVVALPRDVPPFPYVAIAKGAREMGDPLPTSARWVESRHVTAVSQTMGSGVFGNYRVYVAVITGHFTARNAPTPPGGNAPTGTVATFIYNAKTGRDTDLGLSNRHVDLAALGRVHDFLPYLRQATAGTATGVHHDAAAAIETQWLQHLSAAARPGCRTRFANLSRAVFARRIMRASAEGGFAVVGTQFLHACQNAPLVVLRTSQPHRLVAALPALERTIDRVVGNPAWAFEGIYIEGVSKAGKPFVVVWNATRGTVSGGQWASRPDLYPFAHG